jgi:putative oxidoreductase
MTLSHLLTSGFQASDFAMLADRLALGAFFTISGAHKLFHPVRRLALARTFKADGVYSRPLMFLIPAGEVAGGLGVLTGTLSIIAAAGLIALCIGACLIDGLKRIPAWKPLDAFDYADDVLYLPEVAYIAMAAFIVAQGPGLYSLDHILFS